MRDSANATLKAEAQIKAYQTILKEPVKAKQTQAKGKNNSQPETKTRIG